MKRNNSASPLENGLSLASGSIDVPNDENEDISKVESTPIRVLEELVVHDEDGDDECEENTDDIGVDKPSTKKIEFVKRKSLKDQKVSVPNQVHCSCFPPINIFKIKFKS